MQLLWTVVTYLLINVDPGIDHDIESDNGFCIYQTEADPEILIGR